MADHPAVVFDVETRSNALLDKVGAERYAQDPTTDCILFTYQIGLDAPIQVWRNGEKPPEDFISAFTQGFLYYADNCPFDQAIWKHVLTKKHGFPYPGDQYFRDIKVLKAYCGLPPSVENAAMALNLGGKDKAGRAIMLKLCKPVKPTKNNKDPWRYHTPENLEKLEKYGIQDTRVEAQILKRCPGLPKYTRKACDASDRMNARGVRIDRAFVTSALHVLGKRRTVVRSHLRKLTDGRVEDEKKKDALAEWLTEQGIDVPVTEKGNRSITKDNISELQAQAEYLGGATGDKVRAVLNCRAELNKASVAKYEAMARCALPGTDRLYGMFEFYGTHTGRWAGRLVQLQNLAKGKLEGETYDYARRLVQNRDYITLEFLFGDDFMTVMSSLVRAAIIPSQGNILHVADYSAIEGRGLAWLAQESHILKAYTDGLDMYKVNAAAIHRIPYEQVDGGGKGPMRAEGKIAELALGFGGAVGALMLMAGAMGIELTEERATEIIKAWRADRTKTVALWWACERAAKWAIRNPGRVCPVDGAEDKLQFLKKGKHLLFRIPSGRCLYYREVHFRPKLAPWGEMVEAIHYYGTDPRPSGGKKYVLLDTYGGKLAENADQAACADLMYEALPRLEAAGFSPVGVVHDEIISDDPIGMADIEKFNKVMAENPSWAEGFPITADGFVTPYYRKDG